MFRRNGNGLVPDVRAPVRDGAEVRTLSKQKRTKKKPQGLGPRSRLRGRRRRNSQPPQAVEPASVGIVLDSSVIIAAERRGRTVREILGQVKVVQGEIGVSVVTIAKLVHGAYRTKAQAQQQWRRERRASDVD